MICPRALGTFSPITFVSVRGSNHELVLIGISVYINLPRKNCRSATIEFSLYLLLHFQYGADNAVSIHASELP